MFLLLSSNVFILFFYYSNDYVEIFKNIKEIDFKTNFYYYNFSKLHLECSWIFLIIQTPNALRKICINHTILDFLLISWQYNCLVRLMDMIHHHWEWTTKYIFHLPVHLSNWLQEEGPSPVNYPSKTYTIQQTEEYKYYSTEKKDLRFAISNVQWY